jgi:multicomponent Na+:H+ antiporter subunit G
MSTALAGLIALLLLGGALFTLAASVGVLRFPDALTRCHASGKAGVLGAGFVVLGAAVGMADASAWVTALATVVFLIVTGPITAHLIGRAAYHSRDVTLAKETVVDEWGTRP